MRPTGGVGEFLMNEKKIEEGQPPMNPTPITSEAPSSPPKKRVDVKDHISRQLKALYDEVVNQPVPDRLMDVLNRLDEKSGDE